MGPWKSSAEFTAFFFSFLLFIPVSWFDLKARFFVPTHSFNTLSRAGAIKVGRRSGLSPGSNVARPHLDSSEHGGTLVVVGMTI
jgi:hypothetical protein